jgi:hypothetical protein
MSSGVAAKRSSPAQATRPTAAHIRRNLAVAVTSVDSSRAISAAVTGPPAQCSASDSAAATRASWLFR